MGCDTFLKNQYLWLNSISVILNCFYVSRIEFSLSLRLNCIECSYIFHILKGKFYRSNTSSYNVTMYMDLTVLCGRLIFQEEEYVTIKVKPGWRRGTKITFESKGDERGGTLPEDIIFLIEEKKHPLFKREGDDLELGVEVPLVQALTGCIVQVPTLGGKDVVTLNMEDEIIYPGFEKTIPGQGMPKYKDGQKGDHQRGDLRVRFRVVFPEMLSEEQRSQIFSILKDV
ncbi:unnamed protein product [Cuscuta epithymum]|uniref:Chaperone DnaJ C-terminal domain-containing protein n=1 Tax=Cuscuta epithymum TaxID=186058 RepID=A0AAV0EQX7_9ASTE|nr:unnamed protein product [Cuscuta epithymum]